MYATILAGEFAIRDLMTLPSSFGGAYQDRQPYIIATNEDCGGWYCWTPGRPLDVHPSESNGGYYVPSWDFGNIALGFSSTRVLTFSVDGAGLVPGEQRYTAIMNSYNADPRADPNDPNSDILLNRTKSLKISKWIDMVALDNGSPYPTPPNGSSNASVFYLPEPATLSLLVLGAGALLRRRRSA